MVANGDNTTPFNQSNLTDSAKVQCQTNTKNQNRPKLLKIAQKQHEATHQATPKTAYNTQTKHPKTSNIDQQSQTQKYKQNHGVNHQAKQ